MALGGVGSASLVVALRPLGENLLGGLLLRLQDKFRTGDLVALPKLDLEGEVESISKLHTRIRKDDNSLTIVPNKLFMDMELVNWSRTNYRLFNASVEVPRKHVNDLPLVVRRIEEVLTSSPIVETVEREVLVAATGFNRRNIVISVEVNLKAVDGDKALMKAKDSVVQLIASCLPKEINDGYK